MTALEMLNRSAVFARLQLLHQVAIQNTEANRPFPKVDDKMYKLWWLLEQNITCAAVKHLRLAGFDQF